MRNVGVSDYNHLRRKFCAATRSEGSCSPGFVAGEARNNACWGATLTLFTDLAVGNVGFRGLLSKSGANGVVLSLIESGKTSVHLIRSRCF